jgi:hypothetical protein
VTDAAVTDEIKVFGSVAGAVYQPRLLSAFQGLERLLLGNELAQTPLCDELGTKAQAQAHVFGLVTRLPNKLAEMAAEASGKG